jgi:hypothetical protein
MRVFRSRRAVAVAAVGTLLAVVGVAYATIPDSSGVINTCYANTGGALRAVDGAADCVKDETHLPLGGPTRGYATSNPIALVELGTTSATVASMVLPAGNYLAHAKVNVANLNFTAIGSTFIPCSMRIAGTTLDQTWIVLQQAVTSTGSSSASIGLQGAVTIPADPGKATLEVICASIPRTAGPTTRVFARYRQLDAISVDVLSTTSG